MPRPIAPPFSGSSGAYFPGAYAQNVGGLSLLQKQELLYEVAKGFEGGREALETWTRKDLLQLLCLEMGKDRKYTGVSKSKMVEHLLRLVSTKGLSEDMSRSSPDSPSSTFDLPCPARHSKKEVRSSRFQSAIPTNQVTVVGDGKTPELSWVCRNTACRAQLLPGVSFCKRCSCCICQKFDDNKDPSLWIVCTPEAVGVENECGLSCHLVCAMDKGTAGVVSVGPHIVLDGSYHCGSCGRVSGLIGCWKKQLLVAKDARRVDVLCQRLSLGHRLLNGTRKYWAVHEIVDKAIKKLEAEVGSISEGSAKLARGIVNRLSCGSEVQNLVCMALIEANTLQEEQGMKAHPRVQGLNLQEEADTFHKIQAADTSCKIEFDDISFSSFLVRVKGVIHVGGEPVIGYKLWLRKTSDASYPNDPTCIIPRNTGSVHMSSLQSCSEYSVRVVPFSEKAIGEYTEARCFTKSIEVMKGSPEVQRRMESHLNIAHTQPDDVSHVVNAENGDPSNSNEFESSFKVRDLGNTLNSLWVQEHPSAGAAEVMSQTTGGMRILLGDQGGEAKGEHVSPALTVHLSPGADASSVEDGMYKPSEHAIRTDQKETVQLDPSLEEGPAVTVSAPPPIRACSRKDSNGLMQGSEEIQSPKGGFYAKVTELDDASGPGNSQTSRREESDTDVSESLQADGTNELNGTWEETHRTDDLESNGLGESWAVQVRSEGTTVGMDPQAAILRKRTIGVLERGDGFYGLVNGCGGTGTSASLCAAKSYEFCVKIIRWLECEGHLKADFRMKFLTWFSLRASDHEKRVVGVFIDTLQDSPASLAGQLMDTFSDIISSKRHEMGANGFCNRLWR